MIRNKTGLIVAFVLAVLLGIIVIYSKGFEAILYKFFDSKSTAGSRTLLLVYFIRTALVINISAATLAAAVGAGGLGVLVVNGVRTFDMVLILEGAIPVTLLAIIVELILKELQQGLIWNS